MERLSVAKSQTDYDSPWKEILDRYFAEFMAFFFPAAYQDIDWSQGHEFLDKELQQVVRDAATGRRRVDKLVQVWRRNGEEAWVLIHVEVQGDPEREFPERMYVYNYRLFDRYRRPVASLAVLSDEDPGWRPSSFSYELWGSRAGLEFPVVKLMDYRERWQELEADDNPFAVVVMAHLKAQETRHDPQAWQRWKFTLTRMLYEREYERQDILELFRFIDWLMVLPEELERAFQVELEQYEEERQMQYVTTIERWAEQRGLEQGIQQGIQQGTQKTLRDNLVDVLQVRFAVVPQGVISKLEQIDDPNVLRRLLKEAVTATSLAGFERTLTQLGAQEA